jgi:hypothetical protein
MKTNRAAVLLCLLHPLPTDLWFSSWKILILLKSLLSCDYHNINKCTATCDLVVISIYLDGGRRGYLEEANWFKMQIFPTVVQCAIKELKHSNQDNQTSLSKILENPPFSIF